MEKLEQEMNAPEKMAETPSPKKTAGKKKKFRKNQVIITALAIMIAVAGYINYADSTLSTKEKADGTTADASTVLKDISSLDTDITDEVDAGSRWRFLTDHHRNTGRGSPCRGIYIHGPGQNRPGTDPFPE